MGCVRVGEAPGVWDPRGAGHQVRLDMHKKDFYFYGGGKSSFLSREML